MTKDQTSQSSEPENPFAIAVEAAEHLTLCPGLRAVKPGEGKGRIAAVDSRRILGSVAIDDDCNVPPYQQANRWDYAIGYERSAGAVVHFVEVHSATPAEVKVVEKKWKWLRDFLGRDQQAKLRKLPNEFHWLASSGMGVAKHLPQYRRLSMLKIGGLRFHSGRLTLD